LDIGLPDMDGRELARRIRAGLGERTPLLIALTGYGSAADRQAALDAGLDHYLVKPANIQQLEALLARSQASLG
ncbi:histidine kinase, partial [Massilia aurea]